MARGSGEQMKHEKNIDSDAKMDQPPPPTTHTHTHVVCIPAHVQTDTPIHSFACSRVPWLDTRVRGDDTSHEAQRADAPQPESKRDQGGRKIINQHY
jgi:hypothetical protein